MSKKEITKKVIVIIKITTMKGDKVFNILKGIDEGVTVKSKFVSLF